MNRIGEGYKKYIFALAILTIVFAIEYLLYLFHFEKMASLGVLGTVFIFLGFSFSLSKSVRSWAIYLSIGERKLVFVIILLASSTTILQNGAYTRTIDQLLEDSLNYYNLARAAFLAMALMLCFPMYFSTITWKYMFSLPQFPYLLLALIAVLSTVWSPLPIATLGKSFELLTLVLILVTFISQARKENSRAIINISKLWDYLIYLLFFRLLILWFGAALFPSSSFVNVGNWIPQIYGSYGYIHPNTSGFLGLILLTVCTARLVLLGSRLSLRERIKWVIMGFCGLITLIFSQARTSLISLPIALVLLFIVSGKVKRQKLIIPLIFMLVMIFYGLSSGWLFSFIQRGQSDVNFNTMSGRLIHWDDALRMVKASPIIGYSYYVGIRIAFSQINDISMTNLDNTFLEVLFALGTVGLILIIFFFLTTWKSLLEKYGKTKGYPIHFLSIEFLLLFSLVTFHAFFGPTIETFGLTALLCFPLFIYASVENKHLLSGF